MSGPFIFIATNRLREGKLEDERKRVPDLCDFIEANERRLIAFNEDASEGGGNPRGRGAPGVGDPGLDLLQSPEISPGTRPCARRGAPRARPSAFGRAG